jgi:hypothetical protein
MVTFALSAGSTLLSHRAAAQEAGAQNAYRMANAQASVQSGNDQLAQLGLQQSQQETAAGEEKLRAAEEVRAAMATAAVAAGEGGVGGNSVIALMREFRGRTGRFNAAIDRQLQWGRNQTMAQMTGVQTQVQSQINSVPYAAGPSFLDAALRIGSAGIAVQQDYNQNRNPNR